MTKQLSALILAAGKGVRMVSELPKVLHPVLGKPMVSYVIDSVRSVGADPVHVVVGFGRDRLMAALEAERVSFVEQTEQLGTGHAVQCYVKACPTPPEHLLVICGDTPLLSRETLRHMWQSHQEQGSALTMMTLVMQEPGGYGRILRDEQNRVIGIREAKDCREEQLAIKEINLAVYLFRGQDLYDRIFRLTNDNRQREYYLTDLVESFARDGLPIVACRERDETSTLGINSRIDLAKVAGIVQRQIIEKHLAAGVSIVSPEQTLIEPDVTIGSETVLWPGTCLLGRTRIGRNCRIGPHTLVKDATLGDNVTACQCVIQHTDLDAGAGCPPFTVLGQAALDDGRPPYCLPGATNESE